MIKMTAIAAATVAALLATPALAQDKPAISGYGAVGYSHVSVDPVSLGAITGKLGGRGKYFGIEGEASFGVAGDDFLGVDVSLNHQLAAYAVGFLPIGPNHEGDLFARIGYGTGEIEGAAGGAAASVSDESINFGGGGQYFFKGGNHGMRAEYTRFEFNDGDGADVFSLSYVFRFGAQ